MLSGSALVLRAPRRHRPRDTSEAANFASAILHISDTASSISPHSLPLPQLYNFTIPETSSDQSSRTKQTWRLSSANRALCVRSSKRHPPQLCALSRQPPVMLLPEEEPSQTCRSLHVDALLWAKPWLFRVSRMAPLASVACSVEQGATSQRPICTPPEPAMQLSLRMFCNDPMLV